MTIESRRGCGYRKVGGLYLVGPKLEAGCGRLPFELHVCPVCKSGIKQTRGWVWVEPKALLAGTGPCNTTARGMMACLMCPLSNPELLGERAGLLWVGGKFYPEADDFTREAAEMGVSRRIRAVPKGFKVGEHFVLIAHPRGVKRLPRTDEERTELAEINAARVKDNLPLESCIVRKGIISVFKPQAIEKIVTETEAKDEGAMEELRRKCITPVAVPDSDKDHQGSVFDKSEEDGGGRQVDLEEALS